MDELLISVGRTPNVKGLGLEDAGVEFDLRSGVKVDEHLRSTNHDIYAAGDVCLKYKFTHTADAAARVVAATPYFPPAENSARLPSPGARLRTRRWRTSGFVRKTALAMPWRWIRSRKISARSTVRF